MSRGTTVPLSPSKNTSPHRLWTNLKATWSGTTQPLGKPRRTNRHTKGVSLFISMSSCVHNHSAILVPSEDVRLLRVPGLIGALGSCDLSGSVLVWVFFFYGARTAEAIRRNGMRMFGYDRGSWS